MVSLFSFLFKYKELFIKLTICLSLFSVGAAAGSWVTKQNHKSAIASYEQSISDLKLKHSSDETAWEQERRANTQAQNKALAAAVKIQQQATSEAQRVTGELETVKQQLATTTAKLKRSINNATKKDGSSYTGLGANSLQLYRAALGYATNYQCLSTDSGNPLSDAEKAACTGAGLPPDDIVAHAADYGEYCNKLERQLSAIERWERSK